jgi:hypothetical protein
MIRANIYETNPNIRAPYNPFASFGKHAAAISAWYKTRNKKAASNYAYWERHGTSFNANNISSAAKARGSKWSQEDWDNQVRSILAGETGVQWRDGKKFQQRSKTGWGSMYWEPAKGYEVSYKEELGEDGIYRKTAYKTEGFADYGAHWLGRGRSKRNYKGAEAYQRGDRKAMEEYGFKYPAPAPPPEQPADAPAAGAGDDDKPNIASGPRKTADMTIAKKKKKRKELGAPGGGGGAGLGVSY